MKTVSILLALAIGAACVAEDSQSRAKSLETRRLLMAAAELRTDDRIALLEKNVKTAPENRELRVALAEALVQKLRETGDGTYLKKAATLVDAVLAAQPKDVQALRLRNAIEMNLHRFPQVADYAETMLAENPSDAATWSLLGDALMEMGRYEQAGDTYQRMAALGGNLFSYNRMAYYQFVTGNAGAALGWMSQAVQAGSRSPENVAWCLSEMGDILFKTGKIPDAEFAFRQGLKTFPGYHRAHAGLARVEAAQGRLREAIEDLKKAQAVVPLPEYAGSLEALYEKTGDGENAVRERRLIDAVDTLMTVNGETANRNLALLYADSDRKLPRALQLAQAEFEVRNDVYSYDALSWALYKNGDAAGAARASRKATALGTPEPAFYFHAGIIALANGDREAARRDLERALALNPSFDVRNSPRAVSKLKELQQPLFQ